MKYYSNTVGKHIKEYEFFLIYFFSSKRKVTWELVIEGAEYSISMYHSHFTGKKKVIFEGEQIYSTRSWFIDHGLNYTFPFKVQGRYITCIIQDATVDLKMGWYYDILIDGEWLVELDERKIQEMERLAVKTVPTKAAKDSDSDSDSSSSDDDDSSEEEEIE